MAPKMTRIEPGTTKLLLVEGRDCIEFFKACLDSWGLSDGTQIHNYGGTSELKPDHFKLISNDANFDKLTHLVTLGDADAEPQADWLLYATKFSSQVWPPSPTANSRPRPEDSKSASTCSLHLILAGKSRISA